MNPAVASGVPGVAAAAAAFDVRPSGGMFEVTVQSTATPEEVERALTSSFGPATESRGEQRIWMLRSVRVSLAPARASLSERFGYRTTLVARYRPLSEAYYAYRERSCQSSSR